MRSLLPEHALVDYSRTQGGIRSQNRHGDSRHAVRLAICVAVGDMIGRGFEWRRFYWLPMTAVIVLKPDFTSTFTRGVLRIAGTIAGLFLATELFHFFAGDHTFADFADSGVHICVALAGAGELRDLCYLRERAHRAVDCDSRGRTEGSDLGTRNQYCRRWVPGVCCGRRGNERASPSSSPRCWTRTASISRC